MTKQVSIAAVASFALMALMVAPAFAQTGTPTAKTNSSANVAARIACVGAAVNTREHALSGGAGTFTQAVAGAYTARAAALQQAYTGTTGKAVAAASKSAWSAFGAATKSARSAWTSTRTSAWSTFKTAALACKAPLGVSDAAKSTSETTGS